MKRVRYVLGAAGAVPALGLLMPAAAAHPPKQPAKIVSLDHSKAAAGCIGHKKASLPESSGPNTSWRYWYTAGATSTCVGTVEDIGSFGGTSIGTLAERVRIYSHATTAGKPAKPVWSGLYSPANPLRHAFNVHRDFKNDVKICFSSLLTEEGSTGWGATCRVLPAAT